MTSCRNLGINRSPALHRRGSGLAAPLTLATLVLVGCSGCGDTRSSQGPVGDPRIYEPVGRELDWNASGAVRFGFEARAAAPLAPAAGPASSPEAAVSWMLPAGWSELPATALRLVNLRVGGDEHAECYLTTLNGAGGGLAANINRWRSQMAQPALSEAEIAALPRQTWMDKQAVLLTIDGTFGGMSGAEASEGYRLEGLLLVEPAKSWFLKMIGPRERLLAEHEHFLQLAASMQPGAAAAQPGAPGASTAAKPGGAGSQPAARPDTQPPAGPGAPPANPGATPSANYRWSVPSGWHVGPAKAMREVTLFAGAKDEVECYVSSLSGAGGGLASNLDRWRAQLGQPPLAAAELAALPRVSMLGAEAVTIEIERAADHAEGPEKVLGAVCILPRQSVFVKLGGPRAAVDAQRAAFLEFCRSLESIK